MSKLFSCDLNSLTFELTRLFLAHLSAGAQPFPAGTGASRRHSRRDRDETLIRLGSLETETSRARPQSWRYRYVSVHHASVDSPIADRECVYLISGRTSCIFSERFYFKTPKLGCRHLEVLAALLHGIRTWTVVELLTDLWVLPVVDGLTGRSWTTVIARWHTVDSWHNGLQGLVRWRRRTHHFIIVGLHPVIVVHFIWPRDDDHQHKDVKRAECDLETHVGFTVVSCIQRAYD